MATKIVTKNSSTASAVPTASDLVQGELAVNVADKRLFTEDNAGAIVELGTNPSGNVTFQDNGKAIFGAGSDLQIYHDGSHSYVGDYGTGNLSVTGNNLYLQNTSGETYLSGISDGAVSLYHNNAEKLATTSTGIDVTGNLTMASGGSIVAGGANDLILNAGESGTPDIYLQSGSSTKVKIEGSNGNVGIGTSSPSSQLHISSTGATTATIEAGGGGDAVLDIKAAEASGGESIIRFSDSVSGVGFITYAQNDGGSDYMRFGTASTERMRIDSSGNLLVGQTVGEVIGVGNTTEGISLGANGRIFASYNGQSAYLNRNGTDGALLGFYRAGTSVGSIGTNAATMYVSAPQAGGMKYSYLNSTNAVMLPVTTTGANADGLHDLGLSTARFRDLYITGLDVTYSTYNKISSYFSGSYTSGFKFSDLNGGIWYDAATDDLTVSASHANSQLILESGGSEAMRIDASGRLLFGKTSADDSVVGLKVSSLGVITSTIASPSTNTYLMYSGGYKFYVNTNGGISNFSANNVNLSDEREKKNIELLESQWDSLKQWSLKKFHYNADDDSDNKKLGVIAQEVATHSPEVIDEFNVDDDTTRMAVKEQQMMWMAIKALQEAQTRIETLEARVTELENN